MGDEKPIISGRRRSRGSEATARASALELLKTRRAGGRLSEKGAGYEIKVDKPIYDTVDEDEYDALVARRREEVRGFIVDDDGSGYGDEGQEEDWSLAGMPPSSDESEDERPKKKKVEKKEKESQHPKKVNSSLLAAAAIMGKQSISSMFTNSVFKNSRESDSFKNSACDSIVDEVIAEFAPNNVERERRKRLQLGAKTHNPVSSSPFNSVEKKKHISCDFNSIKEVDKARNVLNNGDCELDTTVTCNHVEELNPIKDLEDVGPVKSDDSRDFGTGSAVEEDNFDGTVEAKVETIQVKEEGASRLNARIIDDRDPAFSATVEWKGMTSAGNLMNNTGLKDVKDSSSNEKEADLDLDGNGCLLFYILDAYEELYGANMGNLYLFGKVKAGNTYNSCCVIVKNTHRCVYAVPTGSIFPADEIMKLEKDGQESLISTTAFRTKLQEMASGLKNEIANQMLNMNISNFSMAPVKRRYVFKQVDIPSGENYLLKINYPFKDPPFPANLRGETFCALLGTHNSALELFLVKRNVIGPSWLSIAKFSSCPSSEQVSWCKFEIIVESPKDIKTASSTIGIPPVVVTAINLKTLINEKHNVNEIVSASVICCHKAKIDTPMLESEWKKSGMLSRFSVVRKLDGGIFPMGFTKEAMEKNSRAGSNVLALESSERALLNRLMTELHNLDSDVLVGHNISGFDLEVLLHRAQACGVPGRTWSKIGRLKRSTMPKITKGSTIFGSGASPGIMSCIAGRLLCDTFLSSRDLLKEVSYSLTQLTKTQLNKDRKEIVPRDIPRMFQTSETLKELIEYGEIDAWLSMELMFHLSILPLTRQLTNISGNLWGKTLQGARAQRVEYLLLHAFHKAKYIVPDKVLPHSKQIKVPKKRISGETDNIHADDLENDDEILDEDSMDDHKKSKKGPAYAGGLVLEPKKGLYDKIILLLDFNSLYPSIIQEYNICFTTVEKSPDGLIPCLPSSRTTGVLPQLLRTLVDRRRTAKTSMKSASGLTYQQLDIQQQALKLTANSMYGCLGFANSRFYAKPLAELITFQGREILQRTVDLVQNNLKLEVIYGDTDSIMICSGLDDIAKANVVAKKVIKEVNEKYKCLEIDLDGLYKRMLLLKKKKYAAVKVQVKDGKLYEVIERKGLDMVRRDWSLLSKESGDYCLSQILSERSCEEVVESIHDSLIKVQEDMRNGQVPLEKYVITKTLTKPPEAYPDAKKQPHVMVALRLKQSGYSTGCSMGDAIPYIICYEQGTSSSGSTGMALRARHPDELKADDGKWMIDIEYYLSQQIHPVVSRLCASIEGTSPERLANCLGIDSSKFQIKSIEVVSNDPSKSLLFGANNEERFQDCEPLILSCPSCSLTFNCPPIFSYLSMLVNEKGKEPQVEKSKYHFWRMLHCPKCPEEGDTGRLSTAVIANKVKRQAEEFISRYYTGLMMCDDETCNYTTRVPNLRVVGDSERGTICPNYNRCSGHLVRKYSEADLFKQLTYFCYLFDTAGCIEKIDDARARASIEKELARIRPMIDLAATSIQKLRDQCAYGWVRLNKLF